MEDILATRRKEKGGVIGDKNSIPLLFCGKSGLPVYDMMYAIQVLE